MKKQILIALFATAISAHGHGDKGQGEEMHKRFTSCSPANEEEHAKCLSNCQEQGG
jgi:hypothetical protein